jgi:hypothetical protein
MDTFKIGAKFAYLFGCTQIVQKDAEPITLRAYSHNETSQNAANLTPIPSNIVAIIVCKIRPGILRATRVPK